MFESMRRREALTAGLVSAFAMTRSSALGDRSDKPAAIPLGFDNFAIRSLGLKAPKLVQYAARLGCDSLFISDLDAFESFHPNYLADVRKLAADSGLGIHLGTWSICPTSTAFKNKWGTADELLTLGLQTAHALGSPVLRVVLGNGGDRATPGGIQARIADTVAVCKRHRSQAVAGNLKIAVENHAGDMQAWELAALVEAAGTDYVGVNVDSGNAMWTMEDPLASLEILGKYTVTSSLRDGAIWESANGATVQWTAMGEGSVDWKVYFRRFAELCPNVPVHIETISGFPRELGYMKPDFWKVWPNARAADFAKFVRLAKSGKPIPPHRSAGPEDEKRYQEAELARSLAYCRSLGLGRNKPPA